MQIWEAKVAFAIWKMETHMHWLQNKDSGKTRGTNNMYIWEAKVAVMAAPPHPSSNAYFAHTDKLGRYTLVDAQVLAVTSWPSWPSGLSWLSGPSSWASLWAMLFWSPSWPSSLASWSSWAWAGGSPSHSS